MPEFKVKVAITTHKVLTIYASDEDAASEKAERMVLDRENVEDVEVLEVKEQ